MKQAEMVEFNCNTNLNVFKNMAFFHSINTRINFFFQEVASMYVYVYQEHSWSKWSNSPLELCVFVCVWESGVLICSIASLVVAYIYFSHIIELATTQLYIEN